MGEKKGKLEQFASDLLIGGISGAVAKTLMSPIERVKILMQTQDSNPKIISGEEKRYSGLGDCFKRVHAEQGMKAFWRGNLVNCLRYAPQQGSALAFNDTIRTFTPKYDPINEVVAATAVSLISGGLSGAAANTICYPFDFARTRLASDVGSGKKMFNGIGDCIMKTMKSQGIVGLYRGWAVTCAGAFVYRGGQLGLFSQIMAMNPYKDDKGPFWPGHHVPCRNGWAHSRHAVQLPFRHRAPPPHAGVGEARGGPPVFGRRRLLFQGPEGGGFFGYVQGY